jgi:hypothetical protein
MLRIRQPTAKFCKDCGADVDQLFCFVFAGGESICRKINKDAVRKKASLTCWPVAGETFPVCSCFY